MTCEWYQLDYDLRRQLIIDRIDTLLTGVQTDGSLFYPNMRDWNNVTFHPGYGLLSLQNPKVSQLSGSGLGKFIQILELMKNLVVTNRRTTKRDIFYQMFVSCSSQQEVDRLVAVAVAVLQVPRLMLGVMATTKGAVVGDLRYTNSEGVVVDCSLAIGGDAIPQDVTSITNIVTSARFILVVEKDAVFQRLLEDGIFSGCLPSLIMVTGKGVPDLATRQLVYLLSSKFLLPVLVLTDCDPYGLEIFLMYKYGSLAMSWAAEPLAVSTSVWLGLLPSELSTLDIGNSSMRPHSDLDNRKMMEMSKREYLQQESDNDGLRRELEMMWNIGRKAEIQQIVEMREEGFLAQEYLPWKISRCSWV